MKLNVLISFFFSDITEPDLSDTDCEHVEDDDDADVDDDDSGADVAKRTFPGVYFFPCTCEMQAVSFAINIRKGK